jgi:hypothetical protein
MTVVVFMIKLEIPGLFVNDPGLLIKCQESRADPLEKR